MKVKKIKIGIKKLWDILEDFAEAGEAIERGETVKPQKGVYFESIEAFRRALTPKRMELLHLIRTEKPSSVNELAQLVHRDTKNVANDIDYLVDLGLVEIKKERKGKEGLSPRVNYNMIQLDVAV